MSTKALLSIAVIVIADIVLVGLLWLTGYDKDVTPSDEEIKEFDESINKWRKKE